MAERPKSPAVVVHAAERVAFRCEDMRVTFRCAPGPSGSEGHANGRSSESESNTTTLLSEATVVYLMNQV